MSQECHKRIPKISLQKQVICVPVKTKEFHYLGYKKVLLFGRYFSNDERNNKLNKSTPPGRGIRTPSSGFYSA